MVTYNKYEKQSINRFIFLSDDKIFLMKSNNINTLGELSNTSKVELNNIGFDNQEINEIDFELQRLGMRLK